MNVVAVTTTTPDWKLLEALAFNVLGRSITASLDRRNITNRSLASYIAVLAEFQSQGADYMSVLLSPGSLLKHTLVSFLVRADKGAFFEFAIDGDLTFLDCECETLMLVTASLYQWHSSIINYCSQRSTEYQRDFAFAILREFDKMGLSRLWDRYSRQGNYLVEKK